VKNHLTTAALVLSVFIGTGCGKDPASDSPSPDRGNSNVLRVLQPKMDKSGLPRGEDPSVRETALIRNFAKDHGLEVKLISVAPEQLGDKLMAGAGDVAIGCRLEWIAPDASLIFTRPVFKPTREAQDSSEMGIGQADPQIVWAVAQKSGDLLEKLNDFLVKEHPSVVPNQRSGDLDKIRERGYIRVLTRNNPACYFIHRGELMGFEYELVKQFAKQEGLDVVMIVPPRWTDLKQWMLEGRGDMIAACITVSEEREKSKELCFGHPYGNVQEIIVTRKSDDKLKSLGDLDGRTIHVRKTSNYWASLQKLKKESGINFKIKAAPETMETREILHRVESGDFDLTMADSGFLDIEINTGRTLRSALMFKKSYNYGWVVSRENTELKTAVDRFFAKQIGSSDYNYIYGKYFRKSSVVDEFQDTVRSLDKAEISPYDDLIKDSAIKYDFHWCLIASLMYQESRFEPDAKSWSGARGLMQLMPATAGELGLNERNITDPAKNIDAGVKYLGKQRKRVPDEVDDFNRLCFALASYNGGYGHLIDARALAGKLGRDPNLWVENVDYAYSLLSTPKYADRSKYGYCRSDEITGYVRKIMSRYFEYKSEIERLGKAVE
jgi:membrane-bound lytic murein transglycosylase F